MARIGLDDAQGGSRSRWRTQKQGSSTKPPPSSSSSSLAAVEDEAAGDARRGGGEPGRGGHGVEGVVAPHLEAAEAHLVNVECVAESDGVGEEGEAELRQELPHAAPAPGDEAGPDGVGGAEGTEDLHEDVVRERSQPVLAAAGGGAGRRLGVDRAHGDRSWGNCFFFLHWPAVGYISNGPDTICRARHDFWAS